METTKIQRVVDELEILRLLATLAQAIDDRDEVRYRACLADEVMGASPLETRTPGSRRRATSTPAAR